MVTIKDTCSGCHDEVELTASDIDLQVFSGRLVSNYSFICPHCDEYVKKTADDHIVSLLMSGGVRATVNEVTEEIPEQRAETISREDELNFHEMISGTDDLVALIAGKTGNPTDK